MVGLCGLRSTVTFWIRKVVNEGTSICGIRSKCGVFGITVYVAIQVVHVVHAVDVVQAIYVMYAVDVVYAKHVVYPIYAIHVVYAVRSMDVQARLENEGCPNSSALGKENLRSALWISSAAKAALLRSPTPLAFNILAFLCWLAYCKCFAARPR